MTFDKNKTTNQGGGSNDKSNQRPGQPGQPNPSQQKNPSHNEWDKKK